MKGKVKFMAIKFYTGLLEKPQEYRIGNVRYVVESHFLPFPKPEQKTMRDRVERLLTSDFTDLTVFEAADTMDAENVCSGAGKED